MTDKLPKIPFTNIDDFPVVMKEMARAAANPEDKVMQQINDFAVRNKTDPSMVAGRAVPPPSSSQTAIQAQTSDEILAIKSVLLAVIKILAQEFAKDGRTVADVITALGESVMAMSVHSDGEVDEERSRKISLTAYGLITSALSSENPAN